MHIHIQLLMRPVHIDDDYLLCIQKSAPSTLFFKRKCNNIYFLATMHVENESKKMYIILIKCINWICGELKEL